jgi:hypothetical protein
MHSLFALVSTYTNAAGEIVSGRLVPEPQLIDINDIPPPPPGSPRRTFVPSDADDGTPEYLAYVPNDADPGFDTAIPSEGIESCDASGIVKHDGREAEVRKLKESHMETSKKRKFGELDLPEEDEEIVEAVKRSQHFRRALRSLRQLVLGCCGQ